MPVGRGGRVNSTPTHADRYCVLSPLSLALSDQDGGPSSSTINIYDLTQK